VRPVDLIVIHCSATPNGRPVGVEEIDAWHARRGFRRFDLWRRKHNPHLGAIGYHFVILLGGAVATGRHLDEIGAHVVGNNRRSIGICLIGTDRYTPAQWGSAAANVAGLKRLYPAARVCGHRDLSPDQDNDGLVEPWEWLKTCPGFDVASWLAADMNPDARHVLDVDTRQEGTT
jgi:N-acetylmuramoyl-L-alanine amidase